MKELLKDIAVIGAGQGAPQDECDYCDKGTPFVKAGNLQDLINGIDINSIKQISEDVAKKHKLKLYPKGTILFAKSGMSCMKGYVYVLPVDAYVVNHLACITPKANYSDYLRYYFIFHRPNQLVKDAAYPSISLSDIGDLQIDLKTDVIRKNIVNQLKHIENIIALRKAEVSSFDNLIKARFVEMFGDFESNSKQLEIETLGQLGFWSSGGTPSRTNPDYFTGDINWYSAGELNSIFLDESVEKITKEAINNSAAKLFKAGSMLVGMYDTAAFKMGILKKDSASNQACACIEPNERVDIVWLYYALTMMKNHYLSQRRGVRQKNLNLGMIKGFKLPIAQKNEQLTFVSFVKQIDKSKVAMQAALDKAQLLFDSLMQEYFG